jgi:hypothetical protein
MMIFVVVVVDLGFIYYYYYFHHHRNTVDLLCLMLTLNVATVLPLDASRRLMPLMEGLFYLTICYINYANYRYYKFFIRIVFVFLYFCVLYLWLVISCAFSYFPVLSCNWPFVCCVSTLIIQNYYCNYYVRFCHKIDKYCTNISWRLFICHI